MIYPKIIKIENDKLKQLLEKKAELIVKGRAMTDEIIILEQEMEATDKKEVVVKNKKEVLSKTFLKLMERNRCSTPVEYRKLRNAKLKLQRKRNWNNKASINKK